MLPPKKSWNNTIERRRKKTLPNFLDLVDDELFPKYK
jgi:hypothetical protein